MTKASLDEKFALIHEHWRPKVVAQLNGQELKLVKFAGVFPWHRHELEDELFLVWRCQMTIEFPDRQVRLQPESHTQRLDPFAPDEIEVCPASLVVNNPRNEKPERFEQV